MSFFDAVYFAGAALCALSLYGFVLWVVWPRKTTLGRKERLE
jgi:hypothetical protein